MGTLAGTASVNAASAIGQSPPGTNTSVSCKRPDRGRLRCVMTIKGGSGLSGTVTMRITRGNLLVAVGHGAVTRGKATLTMRVLHPMTAGRYTVDMVVTLDATQILRIPATSSPETGGHAK
jgi:hypothetical protein